MAGPQRLLLVLALVTLVLAAGQPLPATGEAAEAPVGLPAALGPTAVIAAAATGRGTAAAAAAPLPQPIAGNTPIGAAPALAPTAAAGGAVTIPPGGLPVDAPGPGLPAGAVEYSEHRGRPAAAAAGAGPFDAAVPGPVLGPGPGPAAAAVSPAPIDSFVRVVGTRFVIGGWVGGPPCMEWNPVGWNMWQVAELAAGAAFADTPPDVAPARVLRDMLDLAVAKNFTVMRAWAHGVLPQYALQTAPSVYSEAIFRGLDYALDLARQRNIRVILSVTDNWVLPGGVDEYLKWATEGPDKAGFPSAPHDAFFTLPACKAAYKANLAALTGRKNTVNGRLWAEDPTIAAWNLLNEPRCKGSVRVNDGKTSNGGTCHAAVNAWVAEMAAELKRLDPNHLVTVGEDGFYDHDDPGAEQINPGSWAADEGQSFLKNHASPNIDFATIHNWADNWNTGSPAFQQQWLTKHTDDAGSILRKPLLLEEFGKLRRKGIPRDDYFEQAFASTEASVRAGGALRGSLFWTLTPDGTLVPNLDGTISKDGGDYGVMYTDPLLERASQHAATLHALAMPLPTCPAGGPLPARPVAACPPGFEGGDCTSDVNECARATHDCHANATCTNTLGGFTCACQFGFDGDGKTACVPTPIVTDVAAKYLSPAGVQAWMSSNYRAVMSAPCNRSALADYPPNAPGYAYDPAGPVPGGPSAQPASGSKSAVSPVQCMVACEASAAAAAASAAAAVPPSTPAPAVCTSFFYNRNLERCLLFECPIGGWGCQHDDGLQSLSGSGIGPWQLFVSAVRMPPCGAPAKQPSGMRRAG